MEKDSPQTSQNVGSFKKFLPLFGLALALVLLVGASYFFAPGQWEKIFGLAAPQTVEEGEEGTVIGEGPGYTIEQVPVTALEEIMPDVERPIVFSASVPEAIRAVLEKQRAELAATLKSDPTKGGEWLNLALVYHSANDYEGARLIWEFLTEVIPDNATAYDNRGKLYHFSLHDYPKSEVAFKRSIEVNPASEMPYLELYQLYKHSYKKGTNAGIDILKEGAAKFPENPDFPILLGIEYRERNEAANSRAWLEKALAIAEVKKDMALAGKVRDELAKLPQ